VFKLITVTVIGVVALILLFEVSRERETDYTELLYYEVVNELLAAQPQREGLSWHTGPQPVPGMEDAQRNYIVLKPGKINWGSEPESESRQLPPPPPTPDVPPKPMAHSLKQGVVAKGFVQTKWALLRKKGLGRHVLVKAFVEGKLLTDYIAKLTAVSGPEPELSYYECYRLPFKLYRYQRTAHAQMSSRCPLGKRLENVGLPWVEWGEPEKISMTTCWTAFERKAPAPPKSVPQGVYELRVVESGN
jgi:hypothetical protein